MSFRAILRRYAPSRLGQQVSFVVVGDGLRTLALVVAGMVLARLLEREDMGTYRQLQYLTLLSVAIVEFGLSTSIYRFWAELSAGERAAYTKMLLTLALAGGGLAGGLLALTSPLLAAAYANTHLHAALLIAAAFPLSAIPLMFVRPVLISEGRAMAATLLETIVAVAPVLGIVAPIWLGLAFQDALVVWIVVCLARLSIVPAVLLPHIVTPGPWWSRTLLKRVFDYLWPIQLSRVPGLLMAYLDKVVMSVFLPPAAFAVYSLGAREVPFVGAVGGSVSAVLVPRLVEDVGAGRVEQICRRWRTACIKTAMLTYPVAAFCIWHSVPVVEFLFSAKYRESSVPFAIFATITFVRVVEYASLAKVYNRTQIILRSSIYSAICMVVSAFTLTWLFGMAGMATAVVVGFLTGAGYLLFTYRRLVGRPLLSFFPLDKLVILAALAFAAVVPTAAAMSQLLPLEGHGRFIVLLVELPAHFCAAAAVYLGLLVLTGQFIAELRPVRRPEGETA